MKGKRYQHLDIRERAVIEMQLALGARPGAIAVFLSRARSTILRELVATAGGGGRIYRGQGRRWRPEGTVARRPIGERTSWPGLRGFGASSGRVRCCGP